MRKGLSETAFLTEVADLLNLFQWRWCHIRPGWSNKGYRTPIQGHDPDGFKGKGLPDIIAVRPPRLLFAELKDDYSKPTPEQRAWLGDLKECYPLEVYLWKPSQIEKIAEVLR